MKKYIGFLAIVFTMVLVITTASFKDGGRSGLQGAARFASDNGAKQLFDTKCNICHSVKSSPESMTAPPFFNIKKKYKAVYPSKAAFTKAVADFSRAPAKSKVLMPGAYKKFKLMPKMNFDQKDLEKIADYIWENDFQKPVWYK